MATITAVLRKDKVDAAGHCPLYIRLEGGDRRRYVSLGIKILEPQWNERTRRVRASHPDADEYNGLIDQRLEKTRREMLRLQLDGEAVTAGALKDAVVDGGLARTDFWVWADRWLAEHRRRGKIHYWRRSRAVLRKLEQCVGRPLPWSRVTTALLGKYDLFLAERLSNRANTRITAFHILKTLVRAAIREGIIEPNDNPFERFILPRSEPIRRAKLSVDQVRDMEAVPLREGSLAAVARDMYVFAFLARGLRFGDVVRLRWGSIGASRVELVAGKTGDQISFPMTDRVAGIIGRYGPRGGDKDYVFPLLRGKRIRNVEHEVAAVASANARVNKYLKSVAEMAGIDDHVSFHTSRHSFAFAAKVAGLNNWEIGDALKQKQSATTDRYLKSLDSEFLDRRVEEVFL